MNTHGNLFWQIEFYLGGSTDDVFCSQTHVEVRSYDYADALDQALSLYMAASSCGKKVVSFVQYLREDDSSENVSNHFHIYRTWVLRHPEDPDSFFTATPQGAIRALCCSGGC